MNNNVNQFYNSPMRDDVRAFIMDVLKEETQKKVFARLDVSGIADAKEILDKAFQLMAVEFEPKKKQEHVNEAE